MHDLKNMLNLLTFKRHCLLKSEVHKTGYYPNNNMDWLNGKLLTLVGHRIQNTVLQDNH